MYDNLRKSMDFDDLLFEKRNKDYGAYQLRKRYNRVLFAGIIIGSVVVSLLVILPFLMSISSEKVVQGGSTYVSVQMENLEPPPEDFYVPPPPPPPSSGALQEQIRYTPPVVIDSIITSEPQISTVDQVLSQSDVDIISETGNGTSDNQFSGESGPASDEPFFLVEVMPSFRGGDISKFREWVQKRTNYPQAAYDNKIRGTVFLTFIVEKDGSVSNVTVVKGVDSLLDNEAIRVISESPKWTPGLQRGQPVRVRFQIPLNFMF